MRQKVTNDTNTKFAMVEDVLRFCNRVYVPNDDDLRCEILTEACSSFYITHLRNVNMYQDLRR